MSTLANWTYTNPVTFWPVDTDDYGQPVYGRPYSMMCDYKAGGEKAADRHGVEFVSASIFYFEAEEGSSLIPKQEYRVMRGDQTASITPPVEAEIVRKVEGWPMNAFGDGELPDWRVLT